MKEFNNIHYDNPKTPYQRIMESEKVKRSLTDQLQKLNPFHLRKAIEEKLKKIFQVCYKNSR